MITVVNFGSTKTPAIAEVVRSFGQEVQMVKWDEAQASDFKNISGIIFGGSPAFFTEMDHAPYTSRYDFIKDGKIPVLGICFGHQLMGILFGSEIFRGEAIRTKITIEVIKEDLLFNGLSPDTEMEEDHTEGISLPTDFIHLAVSAYYVVEGMRHPSLPLWGVQFHPEVSGENGKKLLGNFLDFCTQNQMK